MNEKTNPNNNTSSRSIDISRSPKGPAMGSYKESRVSWVLPAKTWQKPTEVQP